MAFKQPRVPEYRESDGTGKYIRSLVLFLKDFCMDVWTANKQRSGEIDAVRKGAASDSSKLDGKTWAQVLDAIYPVGSIYMSVESASPASLFGGTWEQITDRFLLAAGGNYDVLSTGGEAEHTLTVDEMPEHCHDPNMIGWGGSTPVTVSYDGDYVVYDPEDEAHVEEVHLGKAGGNQPHNNMPPYLAVYMWKRVS